MTGDTASTLLDLMQDNQEDTEDTASVNIDVQPREPRDPWGHVRTQMLDERTHLYELHPPGPTGMPGFHQHDLHQEYLRTHPEFEKEYEDELTRREAENPSGCAGSGKTDRHNGAALRPDEGSEEAATESDRAGHPKEEPQPSTSPLADPASREIASAIRKAAGPRHQVIPRIPPR